MVRFTTRGRAGNTWGDIVKGRIVGALALGLLVTSVGAATTHAGSDDDRVVLTVGLLQDLDSPNVTAGYLVSSFELWNLQYATLTDKAADDFATIPGLGAAGVLTHLEMPRAAAQGCLRVGSNQ